MIVNLTFVCSKEKSQGHGEKVSMNSLSNNDIEENATSDLMKVDVSTVNDHDDSITRDDKSGCSRLELLLNATQLISELYPLPGNEECCNFVFTQSKYDPVTDQSPMFSIDCEWCICVDGKNLIIYLSSHFPHSYFNYRMHSNFLVSH